MADQPYEAPRGFAGATRSYAGNLVPSSLPDLNYVSDYWNSAQSLFRWVESAAIETLSWYMEEKKSKARWSRTLRVLAVVLATVGGVLPLVAVGTGRTVYAFWGYPFLAGAAGCVAVDRAFGFSSSWMRYLSTATAVQKLLLSHQLTWAEICAGRSNDDVLEFKTMLGEIRQFADELTALVADETRHWVNEFRGHFTQLEVQASRM